MPEIKNTFTQGKMNKDLDERLVPNGQYRDAMNIQVSTSEDSDVGTVQNISGNTRVDISGVPAGYTCVGSIADEKTNTLYWFISSDDVDAIMQYNNQTGYSPVFIDTLGVLKFPKRIITGINIIDDLLFWTDGFNEPRKINITRSIQGTTSTISSPTHTKLVVSGVNTNIDITEDHITVVKKKPTSSPNIKINLGPVSPSSSLFEKTLFRLSLRYKYEDGEYSAFGPFTDVVFNPLYPNGFNQDTFYDIKEPYNLAMLNSIESLDVFDFRSPDIPEDVVQVDILYKQEDSPVVYSIASVKPTDPIPDGAFVNYWNDDGFNQDTGSVNSGFKGKYPITTENIYAAVPSNQILRPWDNVPKKALAQEVTGSRIVYGNYTQNYDVDPNILILVDFDERKNLSDFQDGGLPSIKSQRNYQLGVVFGDKYGRETPVNTSTEGAVNIPWGSTSLPNASKSHQLITRLKGNIPNFADYYKIFVKETSNEYYNLIMDRAYTPTAEIAGIDGTSEEKNHIWLSFASSDRNKLQIEDYIILKKKIGPGQVQFPTENRFKILDIQNEAPDAIKFKFLNLGTVSNADNLLDAQNAVAGIFTQASRRIDQRGVDTIHIDKLNFENLGVDGASLAIDDATAQDVKNIYISWRDFSTGSATSGQETKRYQVADIRKNNTATSAKYILKLAEQISEEDATVAAGTITTATPTQWDVSLDMNPDLLFKVERKDMKDMDEFSGRFFVKVVSDNNSQSIQNTIITNLVDGYVLTSTQDSYLWADPINNTDDNPTTGVINSSSLPFDLPNTVQSTTGQNVSDIPGFSGLMSTLTDPNPATSTSTYTNNVSNWQTLTSYFDNNDGNGFFIDNLAFVAGQCSNNFYARNAGDPIRGNTTIYGKMEWSNSLEDLYDVSVFGDVTNASGAVIGQGVLGIPTAPSQVTAYNQTPQEKNYWPRVMSGQRNSQPNLVKIFTNGPGEMEGTIGDVMEDESTPYYRNKNEGTFRWKPFDQDCRTGWSSSNVTLHGFRAKDIGDPIDPIHPRINIVNNLGLATGATGGGFVHAMDGIIETSDEHTLTDGIKKWRGEGELNTNQWDTTDNTYGSQNGEYYLHLSFLAPGDDLVPDGLTSSDLNGKDLKGINSLATVLQAVHGGGIFTKEDGTIINVNQTQSDFYSSRIIECEGNYTTDSGQSNGTGNLFTLSDAPSANQGQGYNTNASGTGVTYLELHEEQWNPTFPTSRDPNGDIAAFINNLIPGSKFKFEADSSNTIYEIQKAKVKRLYNHTPWRRRFIWDSSQSKLVPAGDSVEEAAIEWGESLNTTNETAKAEALATRIKNFADPSNRRVVYVLKLDKNPTATTFNPIGGTASLDANTPTGIQFIQNSPSILTGRVSTQPAIWETEPKGSDGLDIYYEASGAIPCNITDKNREVFAPIGCELEFVNLPSATINISSINNLIDWSSSSTFTFTLSPGFNINDINGVPIDYIGKKIKFIRKDASFTTGVITSAASSTGSVIDTIEIEENVALRNEIGLSWFNCFSFGNGIESDRIRDDFNQAQVGNGAKASTTTEEPYQEETRKYGLIFSGLYNSNAGLNELNQFIMAEKITKDLNPTYGSIQKLFSRQTDLITFCEDRVIKILANKDAVFNADGTPQLTANINVLGQTVPFVGDYGISQNPESFAQESYRAYFTDKQRGAVIRLSQDGLTPISQAGMHDWFRENLPLAASLLGSYDEYKQLYNLTLKQAIEENIIINSDISQGTVSTTAIALGNEIIINTIPTGQDLSYDNIFPFEPGDSSSDSYAGILNPTLKTQPVINEYPLIQAGQFQSAVSQGTIISSVQHVINNNFTNITNGVPDNWVIPSNWSFVAGSASSIAHVKATNADEWTSLRQNNIPINLNEAYNLSFTVENMTANTEIRAIFVIEDANGDHRFQYFPAAVSGQPGITSDGTYNFPGVSITNNSAITTAWIYYPTILGFEIFSTQSGNNNSFEIKSISVTKDLSVPVPGIPNIPSVDVDPWAEVSTSLLPNTWTISQPTAVTFETFQNIYGVPNPAVLTSPVTGDVFVTDPASPDFGTIASSGVNYQWFQPSVVNNTTLHSGLVGGPTPHTTATNEYNYGANQLVSTGVNQPQLDDKILINGANTTITLSQTLSQSLAQNDWYMLDVVTEDVTSTTEEIILENVIDSAIPANSTPANQIQNGHLGFFKGSSSIQLVNVYPDGTGIIKQYYVGDQTSAFPGQATDPVYRTVFNLTDSSLTSALSTNVLSIKLTNFVGKIKGVWLTKLEEQPTGGDIDPNWNYDKKYVWLSDATGASFAHFNQLPFQYHSLISPDKYYKNNKFNWYRSKTGKFEQEFEDANGNTLILPSNIEGYELKFKIEQAEVPHPMFFTSGLLTLPIAGNLNGYVTNDNTGFQFQGVSEPGDYHIIGNFDGSTPTILQQPTNSNITVSVFSPAPTNAQQNRIRFDVSNDPLTCAISNFSLKDRTTVFTGNTVASWDFTGNLSTVSPYVQFLNEQIFFDAAPIDVQAEQVIQQIQSGSVYDINFDYDITSGSLEFYYFNADDLGFRIEVTASSGVVNYNQQVTIGDASRAANELQETFVIRSSTNGTTATVDNITMQQVLGTLNTTVSFSEDVRGWVSFKSFIPESSISMSKKYYTMKDGGLYEHHVDSVDRNTFYGAYTASTVTALLNANPSLVKIFNTLNYEGSQSKIDQYATGTANDGSVLSDAQPYNLQSNIDGWYVDYIITDKQSGTLSEFIEKEGKWFNYIRGAETKIKTSEFSFQGLGKFIATP